MQVVGRGSVDGGIAGDEHTHVKRATRADRMTLHEDRDARPGRSRAGSQLSRASGLDGKLVPTFPVFSRVGNISASRKDILGVSLTFGLCLAAGCVLANQQAENWLQQKGRGFGSPLTPDKTKSTYCLHFRCIRSKNILFLNLLIQSSFSTVRLCWSGCMHGSGGTRLASRVLSRTDQLVQFHKSISTNQSRFAVAVQFGSKGSVLLVQFFWSGATGLGSVLQVWFWFCALSAARDKVQFYRFGSDSLGPDLVPQVTRTFPAKCCWQLPAILPHPYS